MGKTEIKLKECCRDCKHFDTSGIKGCGPYIAHYKEKKRVIACGHMEVCKMYLESK